MMVLLPISQDESLSSDVNRWWLGLSDYQEEVHTVFHETIVRVQERLSARTTKEMILMMFVNKGKWRWLHSGEDATALFDLIEWAPGR